VHVLSLPGPTVIDHSWKKPLAVTTNILALLLLEVEVGDSSPTSPASSKGAAMAQWLRILGGDPFLIVTKQRSDSTISLIEFGITDASSPAAMPLLV
jgi:hypothetical protein